jgi:hypothetical protein
MFWQTVNGSPRKSHRRRGHDFIFTLTETVALQRIDAGLIKHKLRLDRLDDTWQVRRHGLQVAVIARTLLKVDVLVAI